MTIVGTDECGCPDPLGHGGPDGRLARRSRSTRRWQRSPWTGGAGDDQITINDLEAPVDHLTLDGGDGSDTFTIVDLGTSAIDTLTVEGGTGTGNDQVVVEGELPPDVEVDLQHVAPIVSALEGPSSGVRGQTLVFAGSFTDADENSWTATVDYGDGTGPQSLSLNADKSFELSHVYSHSGDYTITVTVDDHDGGVSSSSIPVAVRAVDVQQDPDDSTKAILAIGGTTGNDIILVTPGLWPGHYLVWINCWLPGSFTAPAGTSFDRIVAFGQAGDDDIMIAGCVEVTAWLYGGAGDDRLKGRRRPQRAAGW